MMPGGPIWTIEAPGKVNLGLEILGRRSDGYHEIRSIIAMIDLTDTLTMTRSDCTGGQATRITGMQNQADDNLITQAATLLGLPLDVEIVKRIPIAAGLGGASSDAAATLQVANGMRTDPLTNDELVNLAATLGSDIPFFLGAPCASVTGRGTDLTPLPSPEGWIVLATPSVHIPDKTRSLYRSLVHSDFTDGARILHQESNLRAKKPLDSALTGNAFSRALEALLPLVVNLKRDMSLSGCPFVALSGAGPTHYTVVATYSQARSIAEILAVNGTTDAEIHVTKFRSVGLEVASPCIDGR
jgi:4-diphosphocytidyl-2-C-methyl-D-erythritol kinase